MDYLTMSDIYNWVNIKEDRIMDKLARDEFM